MLSEKLCLRVWNPNIDSTFTFSGKRWFKSVGLNEPSGSGLVSSKTKKAKHEVGKSVVHFVLFGAE